MTQQGANRAGGDAHTNGKHGGKHGGNGKGAPAGGTQASSQAKTRAPDEFSSNPLPDKIGAMLRQSYQEVIEEGIPDDFLDLLKAADGKGAAAGASAGSGATSKGAPA